MSLKSHLWSSFFVFPKEILPTHLYKRILAENMMITQENFEILEPILIATRFLGILPIQYTKVGNKYKLKKSFVFSIYSCILTIVLTGATFWGVIDDLNKDEKDSIRMKDHKNRYVTSCDISVVIVVVLIGTICLPSKLKQFWNLLECLNQVDLIIPLTRHRQHRRSSVVFIAVTYMATSLIVIFDITVWSIITNERVNSSVEYTKNYGTFYVLYLIIITQELLFWHLIFFIKIRILGINENLRAMKKNLMENFDLMFSKLASTKIKVVEVKKNVLDHKTMGDVNLVDRISVFAKVHERIVEAVQSVNTCSGYGIPWITLSCLLHLIVTPYFLLTEVTSSAGNMCFIGLQSAWMLSHIGRLLIIVEPCQECLDEHQKTSFLLCDLLSSNFDETVKNSLAIFAMQVKCCKIQFTSCGFFKINRSLITSVAGAVTTYLVILFQFNTN